MNFLISYDIPPAMDDMSYVTLRLRRKDISYMRFILEGYDGLGIPSTIDAHLAQMCIMYPTCQQNTVEAFITAMSQEILLTEISWGKDLIPQSMRPET